MNVQFKGIAVPGLKGKGKEDSLQLKSFGESPNKFRNFEAHFTILNEHVVEKDWLYNLKDYEGDSLESAPKEWISYVESGPDYLDRISYDSQTSGASLHKILASEKEYLRLTRTTQGKFREKLLKEFPSCKVCGLKIKELLVASHIKPWKDCDDEERVDASNGFLLCPSHNALFDSGLITVEDTGDILISELLDKKEYPLLNVREGLGVDVKHKHSKYLKWHRDTVFRDKA
ncbi:hypothetical protein N781_18445 [Pontibacillus halophilus JSM 076056 = DSM 19796]|uniref:HNH nuclease domain-containing protein n=1 Tax=Pontibacillus halophilus JSM 076056 = DSM 19796 TaxID=1385510 RepID=A0A0A5G2I7_9BACI|nr:HNH endonuclease [Pontibacillus halophilus]KGX86254.1 hypothetical protein N781_18445 [Pontibacillus halophilus JSM 076056 = DSM 19796]